jgi:outer membrane protein assembly factor BamB
MTLSLLLVLLPALPIPQETGAPEATWPGFRGARGDSVVPAGHPVRWSADENLAWRRALPGGGWSSPIVVGDLVVVTTAVRAAGAGPVGMDAGVSDMATGGEGQSPEHEYGFQVHAFALADGAPVWDVELGAEVPDYNVHPSNTFATETPATDGERIFVTFGGLGAVTALDLAGEELWWVETGVFQTANDFGWASSLVAADGLVFVQNDNEEASFLIALSAEDGEEAWRVERPLGTAWSTPVLWPNGDGVDLVVCGAGTVTGYAPDTGAVRWSLEGIVGSFSSSPGSDGSRLFLGNSGSRTGGPLVAVGQGADGAQALAPDELGWLDWVVDRAGPGLASPVAASGLVFVLGSNAVLGAYDAASGEEVWRERLPDGATVVASPWTDGERVYVLDETGTTFVVRAAREFELVGTCELEGLYWATPSVAGNSLLMRSSDELICVRAAE